MLNAKEDPSEDKVIFASLINCIS